MPSSGNYPDDRQHAASAARNTINNATFTLAKESGAPIVVRLYLPGSDRTIRDVESLAGVSFARDLELAARAKALDYIRLAREEGHSWHRIGTAMHLRPGGDAQQTGETVGEAAYTYASREQPSPTATWNRSFAWSCQACGNTISDQGLCNGPADDEHGHAPNCTRHAATIAEWDVQWEAGE